MSDSPSADLPASSPNSQTRLRLVTPRPTAAGSIEPGAEIPAMATMDMLSALPRLADDGDIGKVRDHVVPRDGLPDLKFKGVLLASAAPTSDRSGRWIELRVYETAAGNHIFLRVGRSILDGEADRFEAEVFDSNKPRSIGVDRFGKELTKTWQSKAIEFFKYSPLAKELYAKLGIEAAEVVD